jgi:peptidoglycan/LPS O-acetylase OafA/YrhL
MSTKLTYRPDVDGLRAIAVLSVLLFHFEIGPLTGGFVGVDVFFVISGYLITAIILREIESGQFSLLGFYDRRVRRILPALVAVVVASLIAGYFLLLPGDYRDLGSQAAYAVFGAGNFYFLLNTGYFDQAADLMPLLHTWSLGVEEQFYLGWPIALYLLARRSNNSRAMIAGSLALLIAVSFAWSVYAVSTDAPVAFYMLHTRAWELGLGALLVFAPSLSKWRGEAAGFAGLALIAYAVLVLDKQASFPGLNALYPCLGAALIIWPKAGPTLVAHILSTRGAVFIGWISYSLYLWHWPVLVFFRHYNNERQPALSEALVLLALALVLSILSWRFIERPFRRVAISKSTVVSLGALAAGMVMSLGIAITRADGLPARLPENVRGLGSIATMWGWKCKARMPLSTHAKPLCAFGSDWKNASQKVLLWGDSHAEHFAPVVEAVALERPGVAVALYRGCAPAYGSIVHRIDKSAARSEARCKEHYATATAILRDNPDISIVILAASWSGKLPELYRDGAKEKRSVTIGQGLLQDAILALADDIDLPTRRIFLLGDVPKWGAGGDPVGCAVQMLSGAKLPRRPCPPEDLSIARETFMANQGPSNAALAAAAQQKPHLSFVPAGDALCGDAICTHTINGEFLYRDTSHLRRNLDRATLIELGKRVGLDAALVPAQTSAQR